MNGLQQDVVHAVIQGKGGAGKSLAAAMLAQQVKKIGGNLRGFDTDQINTTFHHYKALDVALVPLLDESNSVDPKKFDVLMQKLLTEHGVFLLDNGSNTFLPLMSYIVENDVFEMLASAGKRVYIHVVVAGGDCYYETLKGFDAIAKATNVPIVLWVNEHFGKLIAADGSTFEDSQEFKMHQDRIHGLVLMEKRNPLTFGEDIKRVSMERLTLNEVLASPNFTLMEKQRVKIVFNAIFEQLGTMHF